MSDVAVKVQNVYKTFRIYHEKRNSIYESVIGWFSRKKYYEDLEVLKDISFEIKKGEMFGIIGKNGTGKTTLLRVISGVYQPDKGKVTLDGSLIPFLDLGSGFQGDLTARTNAIQYGILLGFKKKEITKRVNDIMKFADLEKFSDTKLKNFSAGMFARLAFSTAVQVDPDILIIDEVIQVGDLAFQQKSYDTILSFKKRGKAVILVSHNMEAIKEHCDRAMFLNNGIIESIGKPSEVIEAYKKASFSH